MAFINFEKYHSKFEKKCIYYLSKIFYYYLQIIKVILFCLYKSFFFLLYFIQTLWFLPIVLICAYQVYILLFALFMLLVSGEILVLIHDRFFFDLLNIFIKFNWEMYYYVIQPCIFYLSFYSLFILKIICFWLWTLFLAILLFIKTMIIIYFKSNLIDDLISLYNYFLILFNK